MSTAAAAAASSSIPAQFNEQYLNDLLQNGCSSASRSRTLALLTVGLYAQQPDEANRRDAWQRIQAAFLDSVAAEGAHSVPRPSLNLLDSGIRVILPAKYEKEDSGLLKAVFYLAMLDIIEAVGYNCRNRKRLEIPCLVEFFEFNTPNNRNSLDTLVSEYLALVLFCLHNWQVNNSGSYNVGSTLLEFDFEVNSQDVGSLGCSVKTKLLVERLRCFAGQGMRDGRKKTKKKTKTKTKTTRVPAEYLKGGRQVGNEWSDCENLILHNCTGCLYKRLLLEANEVKKPSQMMPERTGKFCETDCWSGLRTFLQLGRHPESNCRVSLLSTPHVFELRYALNLMKFDHHMTVPTHKTIVDKLSSDFPQQQQRQQRRLITQSNTEEDELESHARITVSRIDITHCH